jgi:pimeloyl-ACP methyl ester carboxylesterase
MQKVTSKDGTKIAYLKQGTGPAIVLVDGAMSWTKMGDSHTVMAELSQYFTVYAYDRRGRGESGDTKPYNIEREIEDLAAVLEVAGSDAYVCGFSSGAALSFYAAAAGVKMKKLMLYEAPFTVVDETDVKPPTDAVEALDNFVAKGDRAGVLNYFATEILNMPRLLVQFLGLFNKKNARVVESVAHTLPYDIRILDKTKFKTPNETAKKIAVPTVVLYGDKTAKNLKKASVALADAIPDAKLTAVPGSSHFVKPQKLVPVLVEVR